MDRYGDLGMHIVIDLRRSFTKEELARAMQAAVNAFPVLGRRYEPGFWRDRWIDVDGPVSDAVHVVDEPNDLEAATANWARRAIDSTRERPLRLVLLRRHEGARLIMSITHLSTDGGGAAAVGHVLGSALYGVPTQAPVDPRRTVRSALSGLRWFHLPVLAKDIAAAFAVPMQIFRAAPRERAFAFDSSEEACWRHLTIEREGLERIKAHCKPAQASINDALVAALARVAAARSSHGPLAVMYTMDLRRYAGSARLTAANTSSIMSVLVPREAVGDLAQTARAVARITQRQQRSFAGPAFLLAPSVLAMGAPHAWVRSAVKMLHPILLELPLQRGLIFTNVGKIDHGLTAFGDDVEDVRIIGPNVAGVDVPAVVAFGFRGALHLELFGAPGLAASGLEDLEKELLAALEL
jgi:NRPS condensation-like uncharacterized protein